jgi:alpha-glucosidase (family GH31 glycosyl hydrolase)
MIRHRPGGRGHPYLEEPEQRTPVHPFAGAGFTLGAVTSADVRGLSLELERGDRISTVPLVQAGDAIPTELEEWGKRANRQVQGHLAETAAIAAEEGVVAWRGKAPALTAGETVRYRFRAAGETTEWFDVAACAWSAGELDVIGPARLRDRVVAGSTGFVTDGSRVYAARFALRLENGERVVGFGERFNRVDLRGTRVDTPVFDQYKGQGERSYIPMPFGIVVGGGFGFHLDTGYRARFDIGVERPDRIEVEVILAPGVERPELSLELFEGDPTEVLGQLLDRVGRPSPLPDWVFRLWLSGNGWNSQQRILAEVERSEAVGIPAGVVVIEAWSDEQTFVAFNDAVYEPHADGSPHRLADFEFPADGRWPDPKGLVNELHARGLRVLLWQIPLALVDAEGQAMHDAAVMIERGYCVAADDGSPYRNPGGWFNDALLLDFTNDEATRWWLEKRRYLVDEVGVDGFKTDGGEHAWAADLRYADGSRGGETNNRYPVLYGGAYHRFLRESGRDALTFSRAGYTGSQAIPAHWAGDEDSTWEALRASITAGITASACGILYWSFDLGGFSGPLPSAELYLRAAAVAAFVPIMQLHSEFNSADRTPWNVAEQTGDARVLPAFRRLVQLRERLVPYLAAESAKSVRTSKPLLRGLFFESEDERQWSFPYEFLLGDDLLVAPVVDDGVGELEVFLPDGNWVHAWDGARVGGGAIVTVAAPLGGIPVFVAATVAERLGPSFRGLDESFEARHALVEVT